MIWKQYMRLAAISVIFILMFSGLTYVEDSSNNPISAKADDCIHVYNNTSSVYLGSGFLKKIPIFSYGSGGSIYYYDDVRTTGALKPPNSLLLCINSSKYNTTMEANNITFGESGSFHLSLNPGNYKIFAYFIFDVNVKAVNNTTAYRWFQKNVTGSVILSIIRPPVTIFEYPLAVSITAGVIFSVMSLLEMEKFKKKIRKK
ncbi:MAG: hypothetical protein M1496_07760 [Candidatus Thermoplasmatota archaeon]|jgi:hypothetical protein|nr:hypothetical protein [Candidatus Thermoplasmatota archaeon]